MGLFSFSAKPGDFAFLRGGLEQFDCAGLLDGLDAAVDTELGIDVLCMGFEGIGRKEQLFRHLGWR